jgi:hypothetical protein
MLSNLLYGENLTQLVMRSSRRRIVKLYTGAGQMRGREHRTRGKEKVMVAREALGGQQVGRDDAITTRIGAVAFPLAILVYVVSTAIHPSGVVMNNPIIFRVYAQDDSWIAVHFAQWLAVLLLFGGLVALYYSITTYSEAGAGVVARFGLAAAVLTAASLTILQAVDGVALKWAVDE